MSAENGVRKMPGYTKVAIALHWAIAGAFAFQLGLGWRMGGVSGPQTFAVYQLHKSVGITILLLTLFRAAWRLHSPPPAFPASISAVERRIAHLVHWLFYGLLLGLPLSGWLVVSSSGVLVPTYLFGTLWWPHLPVISDLPAGTRQTVNQTSATAHVALVWISLGAIALHIAGALKHQFIDRKGDLARITRLPRAALSTAAILILAAFLASMLFGFRVPLRPLTLAQPSRPDAQQQSQFAPRSTSEVRIANSPSSKKTLSSAAEPLVAGSAKPIGSAWRVRTSDSTIRFHTAWSQGPIDGGFKIWRAKIRFDPSKLAMASATITINVASVFAADAEQQSALPAADWFSAATHPSATWHGTEFRHLGGDRYQASGTLSLRGISRPLPLSFTLSITGDTATMSGQSVVDRTLFGVGQGEWASTTDLPAEVTVSINLKADRIQTQM